MAPLLTTVLFGVPAFLVGLFGLLRSPGERTPSRKALFTWLTLATVSQVMMIHEVYLGFDRLTGVNNLATLTSHSLGLAAGAYAQVMFAHWTLKDQDSEEKARRSARKRQAIMAVAVIAMVALFFASGSSPESFWWRTENAHKPAVAVYLALFGIGLGWCCFELGRLSFRYARKTTGSIRLALAVFSAGGWTGFAYTAGVLVHALTTAASTDLVAEGAYHRFSQIAQILSIGLMGLGGAIGGAAKTTIESVLRARHAWLCSRMEPLWDVLVRTYPAVKRGRARYGMRGWVTNFAGDGRKLTQRTMEVRDGYHRLQDWIDDDVAVLARAIGARAGLSVDDADIVAEAAQIAIALEARRQNRPPQRVGTICVETADQHGDAPWLARVSEAFVTSPIVEKLTEQFNQAAGQPGNWAADTMRDLGFSTESSR